MKKFFVDFKCRNNGVTMIALVITIIVLIILAGITIYAVASQGIIDKAQKAKFQTEVQSLSEKLDEYKVSAKISNEDYDTKLLSWDGANNPTNTAKRFDSNNEDTITEIIGDIPNDLNGKIIIANGELNFKNLTENEQNWLEEIKTKISENKENNENLQINVDDNGYITLNGTLSKEEYLIKLSDGFEINKVEANSANELFNNWISKSNPIAYKGDYLEQTIEKVSGSVSFTGDGELKTAVRTRNNAPILYCNMKDNTYSSSVIIENDAMYNYLYIGSISDGSIKCDNLKLKVNITKRDPVVNQAKLNLKEEDQTFGSFSCKINSLNHVTVNGPTGKSFLKITDGIDRRVNSMSDNTWVKNGSVIAKAGDKIRVVIQKISGDFSASTNTTQFNVVIRGTDNLTVTSIKLNGYQFDNNIAMSKEVTLTKDVTVYYLFFNNGIICDNFTFKPYIEILQ